MINNLENKRVLVTGGTGMIGRYLVDKLLEKNCDVTMWIVTGKHRENA